MIEMLIQLLVVLIIFGVIMWAVQAYLPVPVPFKNIIMLVLVLIFVLVLVSLFLGVGGLHWRR